MHNRVRVAGQPRRARFRPSERESVLARTHFLYACAFSVYHFLSREQQKLPPPSLSLSLSFVIFSHSEYRNLREQSLDIERASRESVRSKREKGMGVERKKRSLLTNVRSVIENRKENSWNLIRTRRQSERANGRRSTDPGCFA